MAHCKSSCPVRLYNAVAPSSFACSRLFVTVLTRCSSRACSTWGDVDAVAPVNNVVEASNVVVPVRFRDSTGLKGGKFVQQCT